MTRPFPKSETPANLPVGERWLAAVPALAAIAIAVGSRIEPLAKGLAPAWMIPQVPMAPLVADAMWLLGAALIVLNWRHRLPAWRVIAAGSAGLLIVGLVAFGAQARSFASASLGLMAVVVLLVALAPDRRSRLRASGLVVALFLLTGHGIILLGHHLNVSLVGDPQLSPTAWTTALALTALSFALVITCGASGWFVRDILGETTDDKRLVPHLVKRQRRLALLVLGLVFTVVAAGGYLYLRNAIHQRREILAAELTQIADLKTAQLESWLRERRADAVTLARAPFLGGDRAGVERYLNDFRRAYGYREIAVLDRTWAPVTSASARSLTALPAELIEQAMQAPEILVEDLAAMPDGTVGMGFIAPRRTPDGGFAGAVRLRVDAAVHVFPIIQSWPVKSETAETIIIRREGLTVLALSNLRFRPNTALRFRSPLGQRDLPAAVAALDRRVELSEGVDYRGEPVLWLSRPIGGTTWVMLAKMDQTEAYAALRTDTWRVAGGFAVGLLAVGLLIGNYWRSRQRYYERQHVETEEERRVAVERLALVLKYAHDVILLLDENMRIVEANDRALQVYGRTPLEMRQLSAPDLRPEQTRETVKLDFKRALTAEGVTFETLHQRRDGTPFPVEVSSTAVEIEGRRHVLSIIRDISRRKAMEDDLKRQEARFRFIFEHAPVGICLEVGDNEVLANDEHVRITGVPAKDSGIPGIFARASHPEDYARQLLALVPFQRGEVDEFRFEKRYLHPDGRAVWARMNSHWFVDPASGKRWWLTILSEITEQKLREDELRRQSAKFRFVFDRLPVGISLRTSASGLEVNAAHVRLTGVAAADSNRPGVFAAVTHPDDYARQLELTQPFLRGEVDSVSLEKRYLHPDGRIVWVEFSTCNFVEPVTGEHQALTTITDITEQKRIETELRQQSAKFQFIHDHLPVGVSLWTKTHGLELNPAYIRLSGIAAADANRPGVFTRATHPEDHARQRAITERFNRGEIDQFSLEKRYLHPDGTVVWVEFTSHRFTEPVTGEQQTLTTVTDITEARRLTRELQASEALHRALFENMDLGVVYHDAVGAIATANPAACRILGLTLDQMRGRDPFDPRWHAVREDGSHFPGDEHPGMVAMRTGQRVHDVIMGIQTGSDAKARWLLVHAVPEFNAGEARPYRAFSIFADITERRQSQLALEASEAKFRRLLEMVPLPLGHADKDGRIAFTNERFLRTFGYAPAEVPTVEAWWQRAYPDPQYRAELMTLWERALRQAVATNGEIAATESRITCKDGSVRTVEISGMVLGEETLVAFVDITERVETERKLRQQSRIIEQAPLSIAITDLTGAIEYVNPRFCEVTGYTLEEVLDQNPRVLKSGKTAPEVFTQMWQALGRGEVWRGELCNKKKNGDLYYEQAVIAPVTDENGAITHYVALKEDITERKSREDALRETQERYRLIAENTNDTIWLYDLATERFTYCSPSIVRLRGYTVEEMLGQKMADSLTPASAAQVARLVPDRLARFAAGDLSVRTEINELEQVHRDGRIIATEVSTTLLADAAGRVTQILGVTRDITERRRAEKALQESRDRLVQAEQIARLGKWSLELATGQVTWSDEMYRLLELDPATTTPSVELYHSFLPPEDRDLLQRRFTEAMETRERFVLGTRLILRSGQLKYAEGTGEVIVDAAGRPIRAIGTVQDVTERRRIEIELHELVKGRRVLRAISQALEQRTLDRTALLALVVRELPTAMTYPADARAEVVIDGQRQEAGAPGTPLARLTAPITINDRVAGEVAVGYVRPHSGDEGSFRVREREVLESIARTIGLGLGEREAFAAVRQFNAELEGKVAARTAELAARNRQIQSLFNTIPDTVLRVGTDGAVLFSQRAPESPRLAAITPLPDTVPSYRATADLLAACRELGRRALAENGTVSSDIEVTTPGGPVAIELRAAPTGTEEFVVFARDITARKRLEAEVTAMLAKEREISEMKTRFISVTSHEFRTPMAAALGSVELLHNHFARMTPEKREELFTRIYGSLHRMTDMLDDILLLNRMDANRVEVRPSVIDLRKFVHSAVEEIRLGDRDSHRFTLEAEGDLAEFVTDPNLLHHILSNLLSNAVRYSPAGTTVTTRVTATSEAVTLAVEDQGIGIPEADRQRVFEAFERGSNVGQIKGTGLGLNIVKRMVGLLGGSIGLESLPGGGSRFQLILPRSAQPPSDS